MELTTVWFILIAVLWVGYFTLEGEVADPQHGDQREPDGGQFHVSSPS